MDHLIERFECDIDFEFEDFYRELKSGKYGAKYSDQPSYNCLKALIDSVNILRKHIGWETVSIKQMIEFREL